MVAQKCGTLFRTPYNFIKYWPIFKLFSLSEFSEPENFNNTITRDPTALQVCRNTTLWNVSVLKVTSENTFNSASSSSKADTLNIFYVKTAGCDSYFRQ